MVFFDQYADRVCTKIHEKLNEAMPQISQASEIVANLATQGKDASLGTVNMMVVWTALFRHSRPTFAGDNWTTNRTILDQILWVVAFKFNQLLSAQISTQFKAVIDNQVAAGRGYRQLLTFLKFVVSFLKFYKDTVEMRETYWNNDTPIRLELRLDILALAYRNGYWLHFPEGTDINKVDKVNQSSEDCLIRQVYTTMTNIPGSNESLTKLQKLGKLGKAVIEELFDCMIKEQAKIESNESSRAKACSF
jgi:hypothetical protein